MENTEVWKAKREKAMDTNTGGSPGYQSQPNSLETHLVKKWGDIGHQRAAYPRIIQYDTTTRVFVHWSPRPSRIFTLIQVLSP